MIFRICFIRRRINLGNSPGVISIEYAVIVKLQHVYIVLCISNADIHFVAYYPMVDWILVRLELARWLHHSDRQSNDDNKVAYIDTILEMNKWLEF